MQINKQNRNVNIYGYDILIGREADSQGLLSVWGLVLNLWTYELASDLGIFPCSISRSPKSPASFVTRHKAFTKHFVEMSENHMPNIQWLRIAATKSTKNPTKSGPINAAIFEILELWLWAPDALVAKINKTAQYNRPLDQLTAMLAML